MNWANFQETNYRLTEKDIAELNKQILSQYRDAMKDIDAQLKDVHSEILSGVKPEDYYKVMIKHDRIEKLKASVAESYTTYSKRAQVLTEHAISISASNTFYRSVFAQSWISEMVPKAVIPYDLIELITYGTESAWKEIPAQRRAKYEALYGKLADLQAKAGTLTEFLVSNRKYEIEQIQRVIAQGLKTGKSYSSMASMVKDIIGSVVSQDGTMTAKGAMAAAMNIVSSESGRAMNAASYASTQYLASTGEDVEKSWLATLDGRTRDTHKHLDGKRLPVDGLFKAYYKGQLYTALYPGGFGCPALDNRCRCTTIDIIGGQGPALRTGRNPVTGKNEVFDYKDFEQWAKDNELKTNVYGELYK